MEELFSKKIKFDYTTKDEIITEHPNAIKDLYYCRKQGFLIKNFISSEEVEHLLNGFENVNSKYLTKTPAGKFFPKVFPEFNREYLELNSSERKKYADDYFTFNTKYQTNFKDQFGVDVFNRLRRFFEKISGGLKIDSATGFNNVGSYSFGILRAFEQHKGSLAVHCGNYFQQEYKEVYAHMENQINIKNQLSYFIMLQPADIGGVLEVLNLHWEDGMTKPDMTVETEIAFPNGSKINPVTDERIEVLEVEPKVGDMILFQGGDIWHRVSDIKGNKPRITFGGFLAPSHDFAKLYLWG